jgi:hypothetical protein
MGGGNRRAVATPLRDDVLNALQVTLDAATLHALDTEHLYNDAIRALEVYREAAATQPKDFYLELLGSIPIERSRILLRALRSRAARREEEE